MKLRDYQEDAISAIAAAERDGVANQLIVLPTGTGKTVIFSSLHTARSNTLPMLVVAHREELLDQATDKLRAVDPTLKIGKEQAEHHADMDCDIVVASVPTLGREASDRKSKWRPNHFRTIVIDEAHHAAAPTYRRLVEYFDPNLLLGFTATPQRADNVGLSEIFDQVVFYRSILDMVKQGWLCPLVGYRIHSTTDISKVSSRAGDFVELELEDAINTPERNELICRAYNDFVPDTPTLVFASTVQHATDICDTFRRHEVSTACVVGTTLQNDRRDIYGRFRCGQIKVVVNVGVLTEGFDAPEVGAIIMARPTRSGALYTQIVGRGTRISSGKPQCTVIDVADVCGRSKPVGLPTILGLPPDFDLDGRDLLEAHEEVTALAEKSPESAGRVKSFKDIELEYELIDIFRPPPVSEIIKKYSRLIWTEVANEEYCLNVSNNMKFRIKGNALGLWEGSLEVNGKAQILMLDSELNSVFAYVDNYIIEKFQDQIKLLDAKAVWRSEPPTDKQVKFLRRLGIPITNDLTKGAASMIISKYIDENPRPVAQQKAIEAAKRKKYRGSSW